MSIKDEIEKLTAPIPRQMGQDDPAPQADSNPQSPPPYNPPAPKFFDFGKFGQAMVPFTPVPFSGSGSLYAWGRIMLYGSVAAISWKKNRTVAYIAASAAALSIATSLAAKSWEK